MSLPSEIPDHELLRLIGRGAYGEVWLARNVMGVMRAVKVVRRASFENERPFEREFAAVKRYEPVSRKAAGLVNVLHAGRAADGSHFHYVMELADAAVAGVDAALEPDKYTPCTLRTQVGRMGRLPVSDCLEIAVSLANGIGDLHRVGLVHRDVKPSNIIFVAGRAKLADIGLVGDISESRSYVGTEGYVPPEGPGQPGADLYSLGRVLYEMATGYEATRFPALPADWAQQENAGAFEFYEIVLRCGEPDAGRRYQTADALLADLALLQSGQSVRQVRQMRGMIGLLRKVAGAAVLTGTVATVAAWWQRQETAAQRVLVERAERAEAAANRNLYQSLIQQARNARLSGYSDGRFTALELLEKAAVLNPGDPAMREEFISSLATPGLRQTGIVAETSGMAGFGPALDRCLTVRGPDELLLRELPGGKSLGVLKAAGVTGLTPVRVAEDGSRVFARDSTGRLWRWDGEKVSTPLVAEGSGDCFWSVSARGTRALAWRQDGQVTVVDVEQPETRKSWKADAGFRPGFDFGCQISGDGRQAVFCYQDDSRIKVHDLEDGRILFNWESPRPSNGPLALSENGGVVAAGFTDGGIGIWRTGGTQVCEVLEAGQSAISGLAVSPDGRFLVSSSWHSTSYLWDLADGTRLFRTALPAGVPWFSKDGRRLALTNTNGIICYDFDPAEVCQSLVLPRQAITSREGPIGRFALHPTAPWIVVPSEEEILLCDAARVGVRHRWPLPAVEAVFTQDGRQLLLGGLTCTRIPLDVSPEGHWSTGIPSVMELNPSGFRFYQLRPSGDGRVLAGWSTDGTWHLFESGSGGVRKWSFPRAGDASEFVSLSPDGKWLAHGFRGSGIRILNPSDGSVVVDLPGTGAWTSVAFSPDGKSLAVGDARGFRLLRTETWQEIWWNPAGANGGIGRPVWFDPGSQWLLSGTQPGSVTLQKAATGKVAVTLRRDRDSWAQYLAMSGDGSAIWELDHRTQTLWRWNLHLLRSFLRARGVDWTEAPLPPAIPAEGPVAGGWLMGVGQ